MPPRDIQTPRLSLRRWTDADLDPFVAMNADPRVMEFFPKTWTRAESEASHQRVQRHFAEHGYGIWVVDVAGEFAGTLGLMHPRFDASFTPCVEVGYRLRTEFWGRGLATEGARAALQYGFEHAGLNEIVSFTFHKNVRSRRVMEKIGMTYSEDFEFPLLEPGHPMRRQVLYRVSRVSLS